MGATVKEAKRAFQWMPPNWRERSKCWDSSWDFMHFQGWGLCFQAVWCQILSSSCGWEWSMWFPFPWLPWELPAINCFPLFVARGRGSSERTCPPTSSFHLSGFSPNFFLSCLCCTRSFWHIRALSGSHMLSHGWFQRDARCGAGGGRAEGVNLRCQAEKAEETTQCVHS